MAGSFSEVWHYHYPGSRDLVMYNAVFDVGVEEGSV